MKIKAPVINKEEAMRLCEIGVDELFCGIEPSYWRKRYKCFSISQRPTFANFTRLSGLEKAIDIAHRHKTKVHIAVNAFFYLEEQYDMAERIIKDVLNIGADGIIVADAAILLKLNKDLLKGKDVIIGCDAVVFNSAAVRFYKDLGATRIVFPRSMTISEMREIAASDASMEYEVFIIHDLCFFEDGLCASCKEASGSIGLRKDKKGNEKIDLFSGPLISAPILLRGYLGGCRDRFQQQKVSTRDDKDIGSARPFYFWDKKHIQGCGACAIYDFKKMGIASLKILDRRLPLEEKIKAVKFIKKCSDLLLKGSVDKNNYIAKCKELFKKTFRAECNLYDCYYPSVFLEKRKQF